MRATDSRHETPTPEPDLGIQPEVAWLLLWILCVVAMISFPAWQVIPFDLIWISLALLIGVRLWPNRRVLALAIAAAATTAAAIDADDSTGHLRFGGPLEQIPLLAVMFVAMAWQAHRRTAQRDRAVISAEAERMLTRQRQLVQEATRQLRTPITIALGHAELLAQELVGREQRDIHVVVGELERLKALSERLLLIAASQNPEFLAPAPADLDLLATDVLRRWQPTASRHWQLGRLEPVTAIVDADRLGLALDALVENAVLHTGPDDEITVSVLGSDCDCFAHIVVEDSGEGIAAADIPRIFDRFMTSEGSRTPGAGGAPSAGGARGTGLGLALVQAIAQGHGGDVSVRSTPGFGSRFDLQLPAQAAGEIGRIVEQKTW